MYTEYAEFDEKRIYITDDGIAKVIEGDNVAELIDKENELENLKHRRDSLKRGITYHQNRLAKHKFMKQRIGTFINILFFLAGIVGVGIHYFYPFVNMIWVALYGFSMMGVMTIDDALNKSAKKDCEGKINYFNKEIERFDEMIYYVKKEIKELSENTTEKVVSLNRVRDIEELLNIKETFKNEYKIEEHDKIFIR